MEKEKETKLKVSVSSRDKSHLIILVGAFFLILVLGFVLIRTMYLNDKLSVRVDNVIQSSGLWKLFGEKEYVLSNSDILQEEQIFVDGVYLSEFAQGFLIEREILENGYEKWMLQDDSKETHSYDVLIDDDVIFLYFCNPLKEHYVDECPDGNESPMEYNQGDYVDDNIIEASVDAVQIDKWIRLSNVYRYDDSEWVLEKTQSIRID